MKPEQRTQAEIEERRQRRREERKKARDQSAALTGCGGCGCLTVMVVCTICLVWSWYPSPNRPIESEIYNRVDEKAANEIRDTDATLDDDTEEPPTVTKANYEKIKRGMFQLEVDILLGYDGELQSDATVGSTRIQTYLWRSKQGGYILVTFHNDYFYSKTYQAPLDFDLR